MSKSSYTTYFWSNVAVLHWKQPIIHLIHL